MTPACPNPAELPLPSAHGKTRVLVADDDDTTRQFLGEALRGMGYEVTTCTDGRAAASLAAAEFFDALILDCRMPHAGAISVITVLRADTAARSCRSVAIATSADIPDELKIELHSAGFAAVLEKPCQLAELQRVLIDTLGTRAAVAVLDDREALAATGDPNTMRALRSLLHEELLQLDDELDTLSISPGDFAERLHRLRSACGFCGATRLGAQARALHIGLVASASVPDADSVDTFRADLRATIDALRFPV
ncbi:response regulator receiver domain-containing protein [Luteibacter rhizovicinus]|uniref:Response regulator receiver domain-containing protein n=1 Tax=Luteibacter rhizovicinus TaxID=242606 RepID=A0A4R3YY40_9GAMM|nr:response regulator [Luteibacter rhizovicinus]TCV97506.1 response regulator receiver domain-containing protein [Luteibacter rhizovicinus]